ncbi:MAG: TrkA family potassium uptake protein [Kiritimatiellia bacterium]|nr:TrkA family potassium uptake protein [Kiritimatiellia bacterium]
MPPADESALAVPKTHQMNSKRIGIIGAGRFGEALAQSFAEKGVEILLIDENREKIRELAQYVTKAVEGDATNTRLLEESGFATCDTVVVAIGDNIEGSIMATAACKEIGVPNVVAKAISEIHGKVLKRVGADVVVHPNRDRAQRLARALLAATPIELFEVADGLSMAEVVVPRPLVGKNLAESAVRTAFGITVLAIRRLSDDPAAPRQVVMATPEEVFQEDDRLLVFGADHKIDAFASQE